MSLTARQAAFVREYPKDNNATQAAIRAGYSEKGATVRGAELLANRKVAAALAKKVEKIEERAEIDAAEVLREVHRQAMVDMADFVEVDPDGHVRVNMAKAAAKDNLRLVKKIKQKVQFVGNPNDALPILETEFELHSRDSALEKLMKHLGLYAPIKVAETDKEGNDLERDPNAELRSRIARIAASGPAGDDTVGADG